MNFASFATQDSKTVLETLKSSTRGLKNEEVKKRLQEYGLNQLSVHKIHWWQILFRQFNSPFTYLLFFAVALSFFLHEITDGVIILLFIIINAALGFTQEFHSEQSLKLLEQFIVPEAQVLRNNVQTRIKSSEIVPGDILFIEAGDIIPADLRFLTIQSLVVDETILTGESVPVTKNIEALVQKVSELSEAANIGFSGTRVVSGEAQGIVIGTGKNTVLGDISRLTVETKQVSSFEQGISKFSRFILLMISSILVVLFVVNILIKGSSANIPELLLFSIALAVGVVPEALPIVTTISFSRGALRLARHKVVVKRLSAIEDLGSIEILCTDKTGTLTENNLTVAEINAPESERCLLLASLASASINEKIRDANNSFDLAVIKALGVKERKSLKNYKKLTELPFDPDRKRNSVIAMLQHVPTLIVRGAPEVVLQLCGNIAPAEEKKYQEWLIEEGDKGHRVIALASKKLSKTPDMYTANEEKSLIFEGLISFVDPIKKSTAYAVTQAKRLGVQVKILTGDNKEVAGAVAKQIGLVSTVNEVITGEELEQKTRAEKQQLVERFNVFARVSPKQKFSIIELLREHREVGFLGEGINDAPALKMAHVGIVVNGAAPIAREAADIVLLQNSLAVLIEGIEEGREIFSNIIKYIKLTLISNFGNFYAVATAALILPFLPMLPIQILLLNLLSDFPLITISTDRVDADELKRPKAYNVKEIILISIILGITSTLFDFIFFAVFHNYSSSVLQTYWFMGSVLTELILIFSVRTRLLFFKSRRPSTLMLVICGAAVVLTILIPWTSFGQEIFKFTTPTFFYLGLVGLVVITYFTVTEGVKLLYYRFTNHTQE